MATGTEPKIQKIRGNATLILEEGTPWRVDSGSLAIYDVRVEDGVPAGPRRFLFACRQGDVLSGGRGLHEGAEFRFLAVALKESVLREVSLDEKVSDPDVTPEEIAAGMEEWIRKVSAILAEDAPLTHAERLEKHQETTLVPGQCVKPPPQVVYWVQLEVGSVAHLGFPEFHISPEAGCVPVSGEVFLQAKIGAKLVFKETIEVDGPRRAAGLSRLHDFCFHLLRIREQRETAAEATRLEERQRLQDLDTVDALGDLSSTLQPRKRIQRKDSDLMTALTVIGEAEKIEFQAPSKSEDLRRIRNPIEAVARASRIRTREVALSGKWWEHDAGALLAYLGEKKRPVALVRRRKLTRLSGAYELFDPQEGKFLALTAELVDGLSPTAVSFVRPLPADGSSSLIALVKYTMAPFALEIAILLLLAVVGSMLGMMIPIATRVIIDQAIPDSDVTMLIQFAVGLIAVTLGVSSVALAQSGLTLRLRTGGTTALQAATIDRVLRLPNKFFQRFSSGDLMNRVTMVSTISNEVSGTAVRAVLSGFMSSVNLGLCFFYSPPLAWIALATALTAGVVSISFGLKIRKKALDYETRSGKLFGFTVQLINGVSKLRVSGAEQRAFNTWVRRYSEELTLVNDIKALQDWAVLINGTLSTVSLAALFFFAVQLLKSDASTLAATPLLTMGTFLAFHTAFLLLIRGSVGLSNTIVSIMDSLAKRDLLKPILEEPLENDGSKVDPGKLNGSITLTDVVFRYRPDGPMILNEVNIHASPGEFVAFVGPSGSGKSTVLKLLLGFEKAEAGMVLFDGQDLDGLDPAAVRRQIGIVLQAGTINAGSMFDAISGSDVISMEEAWEAARDSGLSEDIEQMPMGMHTVLPEGASTLSGGQKQRLLIARALATRPKLLFFDEATSALDNKTQQIVSDSVDRRNVTRVVVAHRLSTIRDADRIYVLEAGKVTQVGTYDDLVAEEGLFKRMVARQIG
ncbi:MAG: NHLP bacteriocin export ABC transporter permease/ATPase subunit [Planctomycetales bacterium]